MVNLHFTTVDGQSITLPIYACYMSDPHSSNSGSYYYYYADANSKITIYEKHSGYSDFFPHYTYDELANNKTVEYICNEDNRITLTVIYARYPNSTLTNTGKQGVRVQVNLKATGQPLAKTYTANFSYDSPIPLYNEWATGYAIQTVFGYDVVNKRLWIVPLIQAQLIEVHLTGTSTSGDVNHCIVSPLVVNPGTYPSQYSGGSTYQGRTYTASTKFQPSEVGGFFRFGFLNNLTSDYSNSNPGTGYFYDVMFTNITPPSYPNQNPDGDNENGQSTPSSPIPGDGDTSSDAIGIPSKPLIDATGIGFITIYNPNALEIAQLGHFMWSGEFVDLIKKMFGSPHKMT